MNDAERDAVLEAGITFYRLLARHDLLDKTIVLGLGSKKAHENAALAASRAAIERSLGEQGFERAAG